MSKFSEQQLIEEKKEHKDSIRKEKLADFFYSLAKLSFAGVVIGAGMAWTQGKELGFWSIFLSISFGLCLTYQLASSANELLKYKE